AGPVVAISSRDDRVRTKRFYLQPGPEGYRLELVHELDGWVTESRTTTPRWKLSRTPGHEAPLAEHYAHLIRAHDIPDWDTRADVPDWLRRTALVTTLHGQHYTGYIFNDYARMLE